MAHKFTVVHRKDLNNVGDMSANPLQYFLKPHQYNVVDITSLGYQKYQTHIPLIAGGGGLIANDFFGDILKETLSSADRIRLLEMWSEFWKVSDPINVELREEFNNKAKSLIQEYLKKIKDTSAPRIIWGAGHNEDTNKRIKRLNYPSWLVEFDEVGVRDFGQEHEWVPCASCMHPALRKKYPIKNKVIWFEHKKQLIKGPNFGSDPIPRYVNSGDNIDHTIELLGSSEIIITNSYHGAYWGTLLGKKVIVDSAWSTKFWSMKHTPRILNKGEDWKNVLDEEYSYDQDPLEDCISATENYWNRIKEYMQ